jgi:hypothetical protein
MITQDGEHLCEMFHKGGPENYLRLPVVERCGVVFRFTPLDPVLAYRMVDSGVRAPVPIGGVPHVIA